MLNVTLFVGLSFWLSGVPGNNHRVIIAASRLSCNHRSNPYKCVIIDVANMARGNWRRFKNGMAGGTWRNENALIFCRAGDKYRPSRPAHRLIKASGNLKAGECYIMRRKAGDVLRCALSLRRWWHQEVARHLSAKLQWRTWRRRPWR